MTVVPTIDIRHVDGTALALIDAACRDHGFFLLIGHGMDGLIHDTFTMAEHFFTASPALKASVCRSEDNPLGYYDRELTKRKRDHKEVFDFRPMDWMSAERQMRWPDETSARLTGFETAMRGYFDAGTKLAARTLRLVCQAMGLPEKALDDKFGARHTSTARLNHYLSHDPVAKNERAGLNPLGDVALGHHTDPGAITLLMQDSTGGLQTLSDADGWIDVPADPGAIVVNMGDIMKVWSNDRYKAAVHRVTPIAAGQSRYSIPYFYQPASDTIIQPVLDEYPARYGAFSWREFIQARVDDNYADIGEDDIQVAQYRLN